MSVSNRDLDVVAAQLDYNGDRAFRLFAFSELGKAHIHEPVPLGRAVA